MIKKITGRTIPYILTLVFVISYSCISSTLEEAKGESAGIGLTNVKINNMDYISLTNAARIYFKNGKADESKGEIIFNAGRLKVIPGAFFIKYSEGERIDAAQLLMPVVFRSGKNLIHLESFLTALKFFGIETSIINKPITQKPAVKGKKTASDWTFPNLKNSNTIAYFKNIELKLKDGKYTAAIGQNIDDDSESIDEEDDIIIMPEEDNSVEENTTIDEDIWDSEFVQPAEPEEELLDLETAKRQVIMEEIHDRLGGVSDDNPARFYVIPKRLVRPEIDKLKNDVIIP